jgi:hypothetical protein
LSRAATHDYRSFLDQCGKKHQRGKEPGHDLKQEEALSGRLELRSKGFPLTPSECSSQVTFLSGSISPPYPAVAVRLAILLRSKPAGGLALSVSPREELRVITLSTNAAAARAALEFDARSP